VTLKPCAVRYPAGEEMEMAGKLVESLDERFDPDRFEDS
jgi:non-homologous end joining protein Ku